MSSGALRVALAPGPTGRTVASVVATPSEAPPAAGDALTAQRNANAATSRALARATMLLRILTGDLPPSGESWPPGG